MGVSGSDDLSLIINGGPAYTQRLAELSAATQSYNKALKDLDLGRSAQEANDQAGRRLASAQEQAEELLATANTEIAKARATLVAWTEETQIKTQAALEEAHQTLNDAKAKQEAAVAAGEAVAKTLNDAKAEAASLVNDAKAEAADLIGKAEKEAASISAKAKSTETAANKALADAQASKDKYDKAMDRIKSAAVG